MMSQLPSLFSGSAGLQQKFILFSFLTLLLPLVFNCKGQYEHFRNRESVFKEYRPYFEHSGKNISAVAGQTVEFGCGVRNLGDRYVSWFRGSDSQVLSTGFTKFTGDRRFKVIPAERSHSWGLSIRNVTPTDTGTYLCQVNTEPKISLAFNLIVTDASALISGNHERYVQAGSQLLLDCRVSKMVRTGEEPPGVAWYRDDIRLKSEERSAWGAAPRMYIAPSLYSEENSLVESRLTIGSVVLEDSGNYKCTSAINSNDDKDSAVGAAEANVTVVVTSGEQRAAIVEENSGGVSATEPTATYILFLLLLLLHLTS